MVTILNIALIGMVLLIAYWWANQGVLSAILHLVCVVIAGAITFGLWEVLVIGVALRGNSFDNYVWGISFVGIFAISLLILRIASDKLVLANVQLPHWAHLTFGAPIGVASGILTIGMLILGCGFIQSTRQIVGANGAGREARTGRVANPGEIWLPFHTWTANFYAHLSVGSLETSTPLNRLYPAFDQQAVSLIRDTWSRGAIAMKPDAASVTGFYYCEASSRYAVKMSFQSRAMDYGERLILSSSQVRLIGDAKGSRSPHVAYPDEWTQDEGHFRFDDISHYATSTSGKQSADMVFEFAGAGFTAPPKYVQVKGVRYRLPQMQSDCSAFQTLSTGDGGGGTTIDPSVASQISFDDITVTKGIPIFVSRNTMPSGISETGGLLTSGDAEFRRDTGIRPAKNLAIDGIIEPAGTRVVQVNISRGSSVDLFSTVRSRVADTAEIVLVDTAGNAYKPVGYIYERTDGVRIKLAPGVFIRNFNDLPALPTAGGQTLKLVFYITIGATVQALKVGDITVATTNLTVQADER